MTHIMCARYGGEFDIKKYATEGHLLVSEMGCIRGNLHISTYTRALHSKINQGLCHFPRIESTD